MAADPPGPPRGSPAPVDLSRSLTGLGARSQSFDSRPTTTPRTPPAGQTEMQARMYALEQEVCTLRAESAFLDERLRILGQTDSVDPCARHPAGEPWAAREFRREVELCARDVSSSYEPSDFPDISEYIRQVLSRLDDHNAGQAPAVSAFCPDGHGALDGDYTQWRRLIHYSGFGPRFCERWQLRICFAWMGCNALMSVVMTSWYFKEGHWQFGLLALAFILISDFAQSVASKDLEYRDADGQVYPLAWPSRLHNVPVVGGFAQAIHILIRSKELGAWRSSRGQERNAYDVTHSQLLFHSQIYCLFLRMFFHTVPLLVETVLIYERSHELGLERIPSDTWFIAQTVCSAGFMLWTVTLVSWGVCCSLYPSPATPSNIWGLPPFQSGWRTSGWCSLLFLAMLGATFPVALREEHYPAAPAPTAG
eukprot:TRINITY_DN19428_c0_g1_i1.p1 TRINITY_DN19428_c0_g1~~TRINITY_DN19428_c0_g1_i1.p1  ORF type:complete len:455 (+),score=74.46 TRINITY_DN19428_c0_g1_i1:98-1366(+)